MYFIQTIELFSFFHNKSREFESAKIFCIILEKKHKYTENDTYFDRNCESLLDAGPALGQGDRGLGLRPQDLRGLNKPKCYI